VIPVHVSSQFRFLPPQPSGHHGITCDLERFTSAALTRQVTLLGLRWERPQISPFAVGARGSYPFVAILSCFAATLLAFGCNIQLLGGSDFAGIAL